MKQEEFMKDLEERINNKLTMQVDLLNGVILDLIYDEEISAYRGYWKEENIYLGIWDNMTFSKIISGEIDNVKIVLN